MPKHSQYLNDGSDNLDGFEDNYAEFDDTSARPQRMRRRIDESLATPNRKGRLTLEDKARLAIERENQDMAPPEGDRWSNWIDAGHGPEPLPEWVITEQGACDHELGVLKTGKEADVFLLRRVFPETGAEVTMAAKRYRSNEHRSFHRDAGYLEGRRLRRTRDMRAIEGRTAFGMNLIAQQWAIAEFGALSELWLAGVPVPYPVQLYGTELLMEFIGDPDGTAAPRLAQLRPEPERAAGSVGAAGLGAAGTGRARPGTRGPVSVQHPGTPRPPGAHRPAAGGGRGDEPERARVPVAGRAQRRQVVPHARAARADRGSRAAAGDADE